MEPSDTKLVQNAPTPLTDENSGHSSLAPDSPTVLNRGQSGYVVPPKTSEVATTSKWTDPLAIATFILALVTFGLVIQAHHDAKEVVGTAQRINNKIIETQRSISNESIQAQKAINSKFIEVQRSIAEQSIRASTDQNNKLLDITKRLAWMDQRPWLSFSRFQVPEPAEGKEFRVALFMQNTGRIAALNSIAKSHVFFWGKEPGPTDFNKITGIPNPVSYAPGTINAVVFTPGLMLPTKTIADYKAGKLRLYVHTLMIYSDPFGQVHRTQLCISHAYDQEADLVSYCSGNVME